MPDTVLGLFSELLCILRASIILKMYISNLDFFTKPYILLFITLFYFCVLLLDKVSASKIWKSFPNTSLDNLTSVISYFIEMVLWIMVKVYDNY